MAEQHNEDILKKLVEGEPQAIISTSASDISVSVRGPDGVERETIYPDSTTSDVIALNTAANAKLPATQTYQDRFIETLDVARTNPYLQETEFELKGPEFKWPPSFGSLKVKLKWGIRKITSYKKSGEKTKE